jgi:hypothetical protein
LRGSLPVASLLAAAAVLLGGCGGQSLQTSKPPKTISPTQSTVLFDCGGSAHVEPASLVLACGDAGLELARLHWQGWGDASATASGTLIAQTCIPNCVSSGTKSYRVAVTVSGLGLEGTHVAYRQLVVISDGSAVPGLGRRLRYSLSVTGPAIDEPSPRSSGGAGTTAAVALQARTKAVHPAAAVKSSSSRPRAKAVK